MVFFTFSLKRIQTLSLTQPLGVTNTDHSSCRNFRSVHYAHRRQVHLPLSQKGFLAGKNSGNHIVDINDLFYEAVAQKLSRLLFLLDTAKAFDSVDHDWVHHILEKVHIF